MQVHIQNSLTLLHFTNKNDHPQIQIIFNIVTFHKQKQSPSNTNYQWLKWLKVVSYLFPCTVPWGNRREMWQLQRIMQIWFVC